MDTVLFDTILFDLGAVLIDWNPRYLYRPLFNGSALLRLMAVNATSPLSVVPPAFVAVTRK